MVVQLNAQPAAGGFHALERLAKGDDLGISRAQGGKVVVAGRQRLAGLGRAVATRGADQCDAILGGAHGQHAAARAGGYAGHDSLQAAQLPPHRAGRGQDK